MSSAENAGPFCWPQNVGTIFCYEGKVQHFWMANQLLLYTPNHPCALFSENTLLLPRFLSRRLFGSGWCMYFCESRELLTCRSWFNDWCLVNLGHIIYFILVSFQEWLIILQVASFVLKFWVHFKKQVPGLLSQRSHGGCCLFVTCLTDKIHSSFIKQEMQPPQWLLFFMSLKIKLSKSKNIIINISIITIIKPIHPDDSRTQTRIQPHLAIWKESSSTAISTKISCFFLGFSGRVTLAFAQTDTIGCSFSLPQGWQLQELLQVTGWVPFLRVLVLVVDRFLTCTYVEYILKFILAIMGWVRFLRL